MKKTILFILVVSTMLSLRTTAQERKSPLSISTDLVSSYVWRGTKFGNGPAVQPGVEFAAGSFTLGAWGSYCLSDNESPEADLYTAYNFGKASLGLTSYYFPGVSFFKAENHAFEINGTWTPGIFSLSANWILNEGAGSKGNDLYFEAGINAGAISFFAGTGNGWYTPDGKLNLCNLGISSSKEIKITDTFSFPLTGSVILNPASEQLYIAVGISL